MYKLGILVTGSRNFRDYDYIRNLFFPYNDKYNNNIILYEGGQVSKDNSSFTKDPEKLWGADYLAKRAALELGWKVKSFPAKWKLHGKKAGIIRNIEMIDDFYMNKDIKEKEVLAFPLPGSKGTIHAIEYAKAHSFTLITYNYTEKTHTIC